MELLGRGAGQEGSEGEGGKEEEEVANENVSLSGKDLISLCSQQLPPRTRTSLYAVYRMRKGTVGSTMRAGGIRSFLALGSQPALPYDPP